MSLESWMNEYYPVPAEDCPKEQAVQHSLQKWIGLRPSNIDKHGEVCIVAGDVYSIDDHMYDNGVHISSESCALCHLYLDISAEYSSRCEGCPLAAVRGGTPCDVTTKEEIEEDKLSPWGSWCAVRDPEPMIQWLEKAVAHQQKEQAK